MKKIDDRPRSVTPFCEEHPCVSVNTHTKFEGDPKAAKASGLGTRYSQPLTHAGTNGARRCLTSQIGRDGVRSACCGPSQQRRQAGRRTWLGAAVSWAECKKEGQHPAPRRLRRVLPVGCCSRREAGLRSPAEQRASERVRGRAQDPPAPFLLSAPPVPVTILVPRPAAKANPPMRSPTRAMAVLTGADGRAAARPTPDRTGAVTGSRQAGERAIRQPPPGDRQQHARCRLRAKSSPCLQGAKLRRLLGAARPTQRSPVVVVGTPSLSAGRVAGCRKGRQVEPEGWRLSVASSAARINQRQPVRCVATSSC